MKHYEKQYEDLFNEPSRKNKVKYSKVSNTLGVTNEEYVALVRMTWYDSTVSLFENIVKVRWVFEQFKYNGKLYGRINTAQSKTGGSGAVAMMSLFMAYYVGIDPKIVTRAPIYTIIVTYFRDFFKEFHRHNPFQDKDYYKYPFKFITLDYLALVYDMYDRIELLKIADDKKMTFPDFADYVVNHALCVNEEKKRNVYKIRAEGDLRPMYIANSLNKRKTYEGKKSDK